MPNFCPECGAKIKGNPKFCPECGHKLIIDKESEATTPLKTDVEKITLLIGVMCLIIGLFYSFLFIYGTYYFLQDRIEIFLDNFLFYPTGFYPSSLPFLIRIITLFLNATLFLFSSSAFFFHKKYSKNLGVASCIIAILTLDLLSPVFWLLLAACILLLLIIVIYRKKLT